MTTLVSTRLRSAIICRLAADVDAIDVVDRLAVGGLGLRLHLPGAPEQIDVVDVDAAERGLQRLEHVGDVDAEDLRLVAVDVEIDRGVAAEKVL